MFTGLFGNSPTYAYAADKINYMEKVVKQKENVQPWGFYVEKLVKGVAYQLFEALAQPANLVRVKLCAAHRQT